MTLWTSRDAAAATGGTASGDWAAGGVSIDSRTLEPGDLFVALADARDGHDFVGRAFEAGAAAAMVSRAPDGIPAGRLLLVDDAQAGLERLAAAARARTRARVVGLTGSVGKTSTKEMMRAALSRLGRIHAAEASFNNHWGVPLTLARMPADADVAVVEIGMNRPGEIAPLARLARLDLAVVTAVAAAHLEAFDGLDAIAREKASIFEGLEPGGAAVFPDDLDASPILAAAAPAARRTFGAAGDRLLDVRLAGDATVLRAEIGGTRVVCRLRAAGRHFARNALAALSAADALGADLALAAQDLGEWSPPAGRGTRERRVLDPVDERLSFDLLDDAFNANPASMEAALEALAASVPRDGVGRLRTGRRVAVLGDMLELGPDEARLHAALAELPAMREVAAVHCVGPRMKALHDALPDERRGRWVETAGELAGRAGALVDAGDVVLVKGSKGSAVGLVVDALRKLGRPVAGRETGRDGE